MPTIHRAHGLRFVIYLNDHEPAHIHAVGPGGGARIDLGAAGGAPAVVWVRGLDRSDVRRALAEVVRERERMLAAWFDIHGESEA
jgi:hypothetical protein